jgi:hypothetical protein
MVARIYDWAAVSEEHKEHSVHDVTENRGVRDEFTQAYFVRSSVYFFVLPESQVVLGQENVSAMNGAATVLEYAFFLRRWFVLDIFAPKSLPAPIFRPIVGIADSNKPVIQLLGIFLC